MIKIRVHLESKHEYTDVGIDIELPGIPREGDYLHIGEENREKLMREIIASGRVAKYYPLWFYGKSRFDPERAKYKPEYLDAFNIEDAIIVKEVYWKAPTSSVHVVIGD